MNYVRIWCCSIILLALHAPAQAGNGNALAGGWNGELSGGALRFGATGGSQAGSGSASRPASAAGPGLQASAHGSGSGSSGLSGFDFGFSGGGGQNLGAPGPEAAVGLPFLMLAGGYLLLRKRRMTA